jgi:hypothetical protein
MNTFVRHFAAFALTLALAAGLVCAARAEVPLALCGEAAPLAKATRTIVILPSTKYVNVNQFEIVKFVTDGNEFAFYFNGPNAIGFDLRRVAPAGALDHRVMAYVARNIDDEGALAH